jgi:hypothetical protein
MTSKKCERNEDRCCENEEDECIADVRHREIQTSRKTTIPTSATIDTSRVTSADAQASRSRLRAARSWA